MELKIGDIVKRFELSKEIEYEYLIASTTKTQAKTKCGTRFKKELDENTIKPSNICVAQAKKNEKNIVVEEIETLFLLNGFFNWLFPSSPRTIKVTRPQVITGEENIRKYFLEQFNEHAKYKEKYEFLKASLNEEKTKQLDEMKSKYWLIRKFKF